MRIVIIHNDNTTTSNNANNNNNDNTTNNNNHNIGRVEDEKRAPFVRPPLLLTPAASKSGS